MVTPARDPAGKRDDRSGVLGPQWAIPLADASVDAVFAASDPMALGALVAVTAVLLVFQLGQPRIFMAMARDGLLPAAFGRVHPRFRTPAFGTIVTGVFVAVMPTFVTPEQALDLTNIGTLSAFAIVCIGVLVLRYKDPRRPRPFRVPFVWPVTIIGAAACLYVMSGLPPKAWERFAIWLAIGVLREGMPREEAVSVYSILTIGDGLVAQVPAVRISLAAGW